MDSFALFLIFRH